MPTPPDAPIRSTVVPGPTRPASRIARSAVTPATGTAAACSNVQLAGIRATTVLADRRELGEASREPHLREDVVPGGEPRDALADRLDHARDVAAGDHRAARPPEPEPQPHQERVGPHHVPVGRVEPTGVNAHRHLVAGRRRRLDLLEPEHVGPTRTSRTPTPSSHVPFRPHRSGPVTITPSSGSAPARTRPPRLRPPRSCRRPAGPRPAPSRRRGSPSSPCRRRPMWGRACRRCDSG